jgi:hypothetical protein
MANLFHWNLSAPRPVCSRRARKLRKRGRSVWWSVDLQSLVWRRPEPLRITSTPRS